jgi:hypothetical protein
VSGSKYADHLCEPGVHTFASGDQARIEKLKIKKTGEEEVRFSWWKNGNIVPRPLDLTEDDLILLFKDALSKDVFTPIFRKKLRSML